MQNSYRSRKPQARNWLVTLAVCSLIFALVTGASAAVTISATMTAAVVVDNNSNGKPDPGDTLEYTVIISDTGSTDATIVGFSTTIDPKTTLVAGSVISSPIAMNDSYSAIGNVLMVIPVGSGVRGNDLVNGGTLSTNGTSANGGTVTLNADGSFNYDPPRGFSGSDTFTYTLTNAAGSDTATVTVTVGGVIWFVNNNAGACSASCDGRLSHPYTTLSAFNSANGTGGLNPAANQNIFLYESSTSYSGPVTLLSGQRLIGQDSTSSLLTITGLAAPSGTNQLPAMSTALPATTITSAANDVNLNSGNTLNGFTAGIATSNAITGTNFGTLTVADVIVNTTGQALNLTNGTLAATFNSVTSSGGTNNIALATGGTTLAGTLTISAGALSGATSDAFVISGTGTSSANITDNGTINNTTARPVNIQSKNSGTLTFAGAVTGTGNGVLLNSNTGATINFTGGINLSTGVNAAFTATGGGTVNATQNNTSIINTLATTTGTALNVQNTTIGASNLTFRSISSNGATNGIVLNNTGTSGGLIVSGNGGTCTSAITCTGGAIQNTTIAVSLSSTSNISIDRMWILNTTDSGVKGTLVNNFSFTNGKVDTSGTGGGVDTSNIGFNTTGTGTEQNLTGNVTITGNMLTNAHYQGVDIFNYNGTISNLDVSNNTLTSYTTTGGGGTTSVGSGIRAVAFGSGATVASITKATIDNNIINNFPGAVGINLQCGNANSAAAPSSTCGTPGNATNVIAITNNQINKPGNGSTVKTGGEGIIALVNGVGQGNFNIFSNNVQQNTGTSISSSAFGNAQVTEVISGNVVVSNNTVGSQGIGVGTSTTGGFATNSPHLTTTIRGNNVSQTDGNGVLAVARDSSSGLLDVTIMTNTVAAPLGGVRPGIRVDAGNATGDNDVCADIRNNTSAGSGGTQGIGLRKQGTSTTVNAFGVEGMAATATPGVESYVAGLNPAGNGVLLISATSGFSNCSSAPTGMLNVPQGNHAIVMQANDILSPEMAIIIVTADKFASKHTAANTTDALMPSIKFTSDVPRQPQANPLPVSKPSLSGETVTQNLAILPAGKKIIIKFRVTVNSPWPNNTTAQISAQGTITCNPSCGTILTDDPTTPTANDPTVTAINLVNTYAQPPATGTCGTVPATMPCYDTMGAAISNVGTNGTVNVFNGIYNENVTLAKSATLSVTQDITVNGGITLTVGNLGLSADINLSTTYSLTLGSVVTTSGTGDVWGNSVRNHAFAPGTSYSFGNPNVSINFASGTPPTAIKVLLLRGVPASSGFANAVQRLYTVVPVGGGAFVATLRLHYQDAELLGNTESALDLWRYQSGVWSQKAATARDSGVNWAENNAVSTFSPWVLASSGPTAPTAVTVEQFEAHSDSVLGDANTTAGAALLLLSLLLVGTTVWRYQHRKR